MRRPPLRWRRALHEQGYKLPARGAAAAGCARGDHACACRVQTERGSTSPAKSSSATTTSGAACRRGGGAGAEAASRPTARDRALAGPANRPYRQDRYCHPAPGLASGTVEPIEGRTIATRSGLSDAKQYRHPGTGRLRLGAGYQPQQTGRPPDHSLTATYYDVARPPRRP